MDRIQAKVFLGHNNSAFKVELENQIKGLPGALPVNIIYLENGDQIHLADYYIFQWDYLQKIGRLSLLDLNPARTLVLSNQPKDFNISDILLKYALNHLIGENGKLFIQEVATTLLKMILPQGDIKETFPLQSHPPYYQDHYR